MDANIRESRNREKYPESIGVHSRSLADKQEFFPPRLASRPTIYAYEDASLSYTGINKHEGEDIGLGGNPGHCQWRTGCLIRRS